MCRIKARAKTYHLKICLNYGNLVMFPPSFSFIFSVSKRSKHCFHDPGRESRCVRQGHSEGQWETLGHRIPVHETAPAESCHVALFPSKVTCQDCPDSWVGVSLVYLQQTSDSLGEIQTSPSLNKLDSVEDYKEAWRVSGMSLAQVILATAAQGHGLWNPMGIP